MFENPRRGREAINFTIIVPKNSRSQIVFRTDIFQKLTLGAPGLSLIRVPIGFQNYSRLVFSLAFYCFQIIFESTLSRCSTVPSLITYFTEIKSGNKLIPTTKTTKSRI